MFKLPYILLVDDDPDDMIFLREAIESLDNDYHISECKDGRSALNYLKEKKKAKEFPCLVVLDINMPVLDGREVLAIMKSDIELKNIPVVIFTTSSNPADIQYFAQFNVQLFSKPINLANLKETAEKIVAYCEL